MGRNILEEQIANHVVKFKDKYYRLAYSYVKMLMMPWTLSRVDIQSFFIIRFVKESKLYEDLVLQNRSKHFLGFLRRGRRRL